MFGCANSGMTATVPIGLQARSVSEPIQFAKDDKTEPLFLHGAKDVQANNTLIVSRVRYKTWSATCMRFKNRHASKTMYSSLHIKQADKALYRGKRDR